MKLMNRWQMLSNELDGIDPGMHRNVSRLRRVVACALLALPTAVVPALAQSGNPVATRERTFRIPFRVDPIERQRLIEVQLHYSNDRGATWRHYATARPDETSFAFNSERDGEYWFTVRTLDQERRLYPPTLSGVAPGLRVAVDQTPPLVSARGLSPVSEQVGVAWEVDDDRLDLESLVVEYRVTGSADWKSVAIDKLARSEARFNPLERGPLEIRVRVRDRAGNEGAKLVVLNSPAGIPAKATNESGDARFLSRSSAPPDVSPDFQRPSRPRFTPLAENAAPSTPTTNSAPPRANPPPPPKEEVRPNAPPQPINARLVNSTRFGVNYSVEDLGKSGLSSVTLYYLDPRTWTWESYGEDEDRESPFLVEVDGEGVYGILLIAKNGAGVGEDPPTAADRPQSWIEVDLTPPEIDLFPPEPGIGSAAGILSISWTVSDRNLAPKSINLFYAVSASGPWTKFASEIKNTGRYQWRIPEEAPYKFYVRLEASDRAGNVGRADTERPVIVDLARPRLKITGVEANDKAPGPWSKDDEEEK